MEQYTDSSGNNEKIFIGIAFPGTEKAVVGPYRFLRQENSIDIHK